MLSLHEIELHKIGPDSFTWLALLQNVLQPVKFSTVPVHHSKHISFYLTTVLTLYQLDMKFIRVERLLSKK
jgi:hypothetical protein